MDLAKYQQSLINIRSKYSQQRSIKSKQAQNLFSMSGNVQLLYQTPCKDQKKKEKKVEMGRKGRIEDIETVLSQRQKQLTERVERNKELLSKSKEVRQSEEKRNQTVSPVRHDSSQKRNAMIQIEKQVTFKHGQIDYLKFLLGEKKFTQLEQNKEAETLMLQKNSNLNDHFGGQRFSFGNETPQRYKQSEIRIKTPLVPPKEIEIIAPIDRNSQTRRIQQRIQMILLK